MDALQSLGRKENGEGLLKTGGRLVLEPRALMLVTNWRSGATMDSAGRQVSFDLTTLRRLLGTLDQLAVQHQGLAFL